MQDDDNDIHNDLRDGNKEQLQGDGPIFLLLLPGLPDACLNELNSQTWSAANHGIDDYVQVLHIIRRHNV